MRELLTEKGLADVEAHWQGCGGWEAVRKLADELRVAWRERDEAHDLLEKACDKLETATVALMRVQGERDIARDQLADTLALQEGR